MIFRVLAFIGLVALIITISTIMIVIFEKTLEKWRWIDDDSGDDSGKSDPDKVDT